MVKQGTELRRGSKISERQGLLWRSGGYAPLENFQKNEGHFVRFPAVLKMNELSGGEGGPDSLDLSLDPHLKLYIG